MWHYLLPFFLTDVLHWIFTFISFRHASCIHYPSVKKVFFFCLFSIYGAHDAQPINQIFVARYPRSTA